MTRLLLLLTLLVALLVPAPAAAAVVVESGPVTITLSAPDASAPLTPGTAGLLLIQVDAPDGTPTAVTVQTRGLEYPDGACRPVDSPDPEFAGWRICEGVGSWSMALTIPAQHVVAAPQLCDELRAIPIKVALSANHARLGARIISAAYRPCYRVAAPMVAL